MFNDYKSTLGFDRKFRVAEVKGINEEKHTLATRKTMTFFASEKATTFTIKGATILGPHQQ